MIEPPLAPNEDERLAALRALGLLDTPMEGRFERITQLAQTLLHMPIAAISLVDRDRQWFKSIRGLDVSETSRRVSFCGHTILDGQTQVIHDATQSERYHDNPLVVGEPGIRFYAGHPLRTSAGQTIGSLCVIDRRTRDFDDTQRETLEHLARLAEQEINEPGDAALVPALVHEFEEGLLQALTDPLTRLWNGDGLRTVFDALLARPESRDQPVGIATLSLDNLDELQRTQGLDTGDAAQREVARRLCNTALPADTSARLSDGVFLVAIRSGSPHDRVMHFTDQLKTYFESTPVDTPTGPQHLKVSSKVKLFSLTATTTPDDLIPGFTRQRDRRHTAA